MSAPPETVVQGPAERGLVQLQLPIEGMSCASCAAHVEKRLNRLEGVVASVNYATENAAVSYDSSLVAPNDLIAAVEEAGYHAALPATETDDSGRDADAPLRALRRRLLVSAAMSLPVLVLAMVEPLQFDAWQWVSLALATVVVLWGGWPFHRAAWENARHGAATMDTLISVGTLAAWCWSVVALVFLGTGEIGMRMPFDLLAERGESVGQIYLEVGAVVVTFVLAGRYIEMRAKRRAGAALRALLELGAKDVSVLDADGLERRVAIDELRVGDRFVVRPGRRSRPTASSRRGRPRSTRRF